MKSDNFWQDFADQMMEEHSVKFRPTAESRRDLKDYFSKRRHFEVADEIEGRIISGMYPPPSGKAIHLNAPDQMYGKIKNRSTGLRIIYYPYVEEDTDHFLLLIAGPRSDNEVYNQLKSRLMKKGRPEQSLRKYL